MNRTCGYQRIVRCAANPPMLTKQGFAVRHVTKRQAAFLGFAAGVTFVVLVVTACKFFTNH